MDAKSQEIHKGKGRNDKFAYNAEQVLNDLVEGIIGVRSKLMVLLPVTTLLWFISRIVLQNLQASCLKKVCFFLKPVVNKLSDKEHP